LHVNSDDSAFDARRPEPCAAAGTSSSGASACTERSRLTVLIVTYRRPELLQRLLASLRTERAHLSEIVVASHDRPDGVEAIVEAEHAHLSGLRLFVASTAGKAASLNAMVADTSGSYLAFLDDDVEVQLGWAEAFLEQMDRRDAAAYQGRIRLAEASRMERKTRVLSSCFGPHPQVEMGSEPRPRRKLTGANFALERIGGFDPRLGPAAAGLCEDTELGQRVRARNEKILYVPWASVVHAWFPERATASYQAECLTRMGRSRWPMKGAPTWPRVLPDLVYANLAKLAAKLMRHETPPIRRRSRRIHYQAMLSCALHRDTLLNELSGLASGGLASKLE
jgi:GT2 family glycosyltransferase